MSLVGTKKSPAISHVPYSATQHKHPFSGTHQKDTVGSMYENYVGLAVNVILSDGREVLGIITEVLDSAGSLKLSNGNSLETRS